MWSLPGIRVRGPNETGCMPCNPLLKAPKAITTYCSSVFSSLRLVVSLLSITGSRQLGQGGKISMESTRDWSKIIRQSRTQSTRPAESSRLMTSISRDLTKVSRICKTKFKILRDNWTRKTPRSRDCKTAWKSAWLSRRAPILTRMQMSEWSRKMTRWSTSCRIQSMIEVTSSNL